MTFSKLIGVLILFSSQLMAGQSAMARDTVLFSAKSAAISDKSSVVQLPKSVEGICQTQLPAAIDAIANRPLFQRTRWGILIQTLSPSRTLYSRDAQRYFIPASNAKLFTTAAALRQLGAQYRIRTSVYGNETLLRLVGRGDPSLKDDQLRALAQQLKRRGIRQVQQLIVEDGYFQGQTTHPDWQWEDVNAYYGASVNSLILNENALQLTLSPQGIGQPLQLNWAEPLAASQWQIENLSITGALGTDSSAEVNGVLGQPLLQIRGQLAVDAKPQLMAVAVRNPAEYFLQHFRLALVAEGITVAQISVSPQVGNSDEPELAFVESPPLSQLIADTNQPSNNLYAEALLRSLGVTSVPPNPPVPNQDTAAMGLNALKATLTPLGVDPNGYVLVDGSGLARQNLVSPEALVQTLRVMAQSPQAEIYRASLPVAGQSGTLQNRFKDTPAQGIVRAKTGTSSGVGALSGYVDSPDSQPLIFSIMVNQFDQSASIMRQAIDEIVLLLINLRPC